MSGAGAININSVIPSPMVADGVTSNIPMVVSFWPLASTLSPELPVPINFVQIGNPTILSINPTVPSGGALANPAVHFLKPNQAFKFKISAGGSLPTGVDTVTTYFITSANLLGTTFTFSTTNNYAFAPPAASTAEGSTVTTSGTLTGTASIVLYGRDINVLIPPGPYFGHNSADGTQSVSFTPNGVSRIRYWCYGAIFDTGISFGMVSSGSRESMDAPTWSTRYFDYIDTTPNFNNNPGLDAVIQLQTPANATNYWVGQLISFFGMDIQDTYQRLTSGPPNDHYHEFKRIKAINTSTGQITFDGALKFVYLSTFPNMLPGAFGGGPAMTSVMHPAWDTVIEVLGARWIGQPLPSSARIMRFTDCTFDGYGNDPGHTAVSVSDECYYTRCIFSGPVGEYMEVDKMLRYLELNGCIAVNKYSILFPSTSLQTCLIKAHKGGVLNGTPRRIRVLDSEWDQILIGSIFGATDVCQIHNSGSPWFDMLQQNCDPTTVQPGNDMMLVPNWTAVSSAGGTTFTRNIANAPGTIGGSLPGSQSMTAFFPGAKLYHLDGGFRSGYSYRQNIGGPFAILNVGMDGSGNFSIDTTLNAVPARQTSATVTISLANPAVVTWTGHGLAVGAPVCFTSTGILPSVGLSYSTVYYVAATPAPTANTFSLVTTPGGSGTAISTAGGTQSGTHTAYGHPLMWQIHPCPRFSASGNNGCTSLLDLNGAIDEPLFSRMKRGFGGRQNNLMGSNYSLPDPKVWGLLDHMTVTVLKAGTGTMTISSPSFQQPGCLNSVTNFSQTIDLTTVGTRTITRTSSTPLGTDVLTASFADWISGPLAWSFSGTPTTPLVYMEIYTDQGVTKFGNMFGGPNTTGDPTAAWQYLDSSIQQSFGITP